MVDAQLGHEACENAQAPPLKYWCKRKRAITAACVVCLLWADWVSLGHNWRGPLRINSRPPDSRLAWPVVIHLMNIVRRLRKRISSIKVVNCWLARFIFKDATTSLQDHPGRPVMMVPPGTVAR